MSPLKQLSFSQKPPCSEKLSFLQKQPRVVALPHLVSFLKSQHPFGAQQPTGSGQGIVELLNQLHVELNAVRHAVAFVFLKLKHAGPCCADTNTENKSMLKRTEINAMTILTDLILVVGAQTSYINIVIHLLVAKKHAQDIYTTNNNKKHANKSSCQTHFSKN